MFPNYGYANCHTLSSGHLDIDDAQCARKNDVHKISFHLISRFGTTGTQTGRGGVCISLLGTGPHSSYFTIELCQQQYYLVVDFITKV